MSGEVTNSVIDLADYKGGMFFRIKTHRQQIISVYPTNVTAPYGDEYVISCAVMGLHRIYDHTQTVMTRVITRDIELWVGTTLGILDYPLGKITSIIQGNC